jgi:ABC-type branched-subunit amino acid transport system ATPase component/MFS family permease
MSADRRSPEPMRADHSGLRRWLLLASCLVAGLTTAVPIVLAVSAGDALGTSEAGLRNAWLSRAVLAAAFAVPVAALGAVRARWTAIAITGAWWIVSGAAAAALVHGSGTFSLIWALTGIGDAMVGVAGFAAIGLFDSRRRFGAARVRGAISVGMGVGVLFAGVAPSWLDLTWRGIIVLLATATIPILLMVLTVNAASAAPPGEPNRETAYSIGELLAAVTKDRALQQFLLRIGSASAMVTGLLVWGRALLAERFAVEQSTIVACIAAGFLTAGALLFIPLGSRGPTGAAVLGTVAFIAALVVRSAPIAVALVICALAFLVVVIGLAEEGAVRSYDNLTFSTAGALVIVAGAAGTIAAIVVGGSIDRRFGTTISLATTGLVGALVLLVGARSVPAPAPLPVSSEGALKAAPSTSPGSSSTRDDEELTSSALLEVRHLDLSYGQVQVLFDVSLNVGDGEFLALLGTNGAGKSTLLKVVSGQVLAQRGSVHFGGVDVTDIGAQRRVQLGLSQVAGGRAVFGPLTVAENLDLFSVSAGDDPAVRREALERAYDTFPILKDRRNQSAQTLSGGQQQMLALAKAVMMSPRMLCIDELSLGLAPSVVGELLDILRAINQAGTAVVLVEQSLNVALSIADRAVFMEKGEIRFDGPASELRDRDDLLRSVFLEREPTAK